MPISEWWTGERFEDYINWVRATFGERAAENINQSNWKDSQYFAQWKYLGRPRVEQPTPTPEAPTDLGVASPPEPEKPRREPELIEKDGFYWEADYGFEGEFVGWINRGKVPEEPEEPTPRAWQPGKAEWQQQFGAEQAYRQWQMRGQEPDLPDYQAERRERDLQWQLWKTQRTAELESGGPMNWIKLWQHQQGTSPYPMTPRMTPEEGALQALNTIQELRSDLLAQGGDIPSVEKLLKSPEAQLLAHSIGMHAEEGSPARLLSEAMTHAPEILEQQKRAQAQQEQFRMTGATEEVTRPSTPTTPPAPEWLSQFAPSQVAGQPITKAQVTTPSGQQWGQTPWIQREQLRGYMDWAGQPYRGMLEQMAQMAPRTPAGVTRKGWQPTKQRTW